MERTFDIKEYANAWNTHSAEKLLGFYANDAEIVAKPNPETYRGREGVRKNIQETLTGIPNVNGDVAWSIQQGNRVAALIHVSGKHTGPLVLGPEQTVEATGKPVMFDLGVFFELNNEGKIVRETQIPDAATLLMQVGVLGDKESATSSESGTSTVRSGMKR